MVAAVGPARFYGSSLPRPWFKIGDESDRVDRPVSVLDPLLSWAQDAHWSMGGHSFKRLRLQGRIEGSIKKLRAHQESKERKQKKEKSSLLKKEKKERATRMKKLKNMEEEEDEDLALETDEEEEEDLVLESDGEEDTVEEKEKTSGKGTGGFRRLRRLGRVEIEENELIPEEENQEISPVVASPSKVTPKPRRRARNLGCEFDKAASVESKGLTGSPSPLGKRKISSELEIQSTSATPTRRSPRSSSSPLQQGKMSVSEVTPRRSSRISPKKVPDSV